MKKFNLILIGILMISSVFSQQKKLTIEDAVAGQWSYLKAPTTDGVQPITGTDAFSYVEKYDKVKRIDPKTDKIIDITSKDEINAALKAMSSEPLNYVPYWEYQWLNADVMAFPYDNRFIEYNITTKKIEKLYTLPENAANIRFSKKNKAIAFTVDNNLNFIDENQKISKVTNDENSAIVNGSDYVHRQEFGIANGIFWSPAGNFLAFYRKDETMVADYPLVDINTRIATLKNTKYPMIGEKSEEVTLGIYNLKTQQTVFAKVTDFSAERYLTSISWDPSEKYIYIGVLNREQNHLKLNKYDAVTGDFVKTLFEESNPKYVEPEHPLTFLKNKPNQFLWHSERDGFNHLYLYDTDGNLISQITKGNWIVLDLLGFDIKNENIFVQTTKDSPIDNTLYKVSLKSGKMTKLSPESGVHEGKLSDWGNYLVDSYSNTKTPRIVNLISSEGKTVRNVMTSESKLSEYSLGDMKIGTIKSADNTTDLYYRMITPPDFDATKKYPVVVYVYGGPHAQLIDNGWLGGSGLWDFYMAQEGYIMFTVDNRGSANRGFDFESVIHRQCGQAETADQMKGVDFLKSLPYVDTDRIGVHGWSYGGFMTISLATMYPETFKVAVAGGPVIDWKYYEVMYGERYMDTPSENPEGFEKTSLLKKAANLKGRLLVIHGYIDPVVVPQNSLDFINSCTAAGTDLDFFLYPNDEHNMGRATRVHLMKKVTRYFNDFLLPAKN